MAAMLVWRRRGRRDDDPNTTIRSDTDPLAIAGALASMASKIIKFLISILRLAKRIKDEAPLAQCQYIMRPDLLSSRRHIQRLSAQLTSLSAEELT